MTDFQKLLADSLLWFEGLSFFISLIFLRYTKEKYWQYFVVYLFIIFLCEAFGKWGERWVYYSKADYYNFFVIPFQFIFFYWLYSKSLNRPKLFWLFSLVYLLSFFPSEMLFKENKIVHAFNYTFGCFLLLILVILEYSKQINSPEIINFHKNKMFYINLGVTIFYIGTLPFLTFYSLLRNYEQLWNIYLTYFLFSGIVMYLLFSISFIWGRQNY